MGKPVGPEDVMKAACWVVIEGTLLTITDVNGSLYYIFVISVVKKVNVDYDCVQTKAKQLLPCL